MTQWIFTQLPLNDPMDSVIDSIYFSQITPKWLDGFCNWPHGSSPNYHSKTPMALVIKTVNFCSVNDSVKCKWVHFQRYHITKSHQQQITKKCQVNLYTKAVWQKQVIHNFTFSQWILKDLLYLMTLSLTMESWKLLIDPILLKVPMEFEAINS